MNLSKVIEGYSITSVANGMSPLTVQRYQYNFNTMISYLGDVEISTITTKNLQDFFYYLRTEYIPKRPNSDTSPLTEATIHTFWKAIRSLYNFASTELDIPRPDLDIPFPKHTNKDIIPFTRDEISRMVKACRFTKEANTQNRRKSWHVERSTWRRDEAIVLLLLDTGLRASETCRLMINHVNLENGEVMVMPYGSGQKTKGRTVFLGKVSRRSVWHYLAIREDPRPDEPLFITQDYHPFQRQVLRELLIRIGERAGVQNAHPHKFRHTFATEYLRNGGDIYTLQRQLGHSSLKMVLRYLDIVKGDISEAHRRASPADRWRL